MSVKKRFKYVLECPRYGCDTWVATTSEVTALDVPPTCYCPNHDDFVEMNAEPVKSGNKDTDSSREAADGDE